MPSRSSLVPTLFAVAALGLAGCTTTQNAYTGEEETSNTVIGAGIGALAGGVVGYLTGDDSDEKRRNALIGAGVGGLAGGGIGQYMDQQEAALRQELVSAGVQVSRVGNSIVLNMDQSVTFDSGSDSVQPQSFRVLDAVVKVLAEYDQTVVDVMGHTDSDGGNAFNQELSERRAMRVANYLGANGILRQRLLVIGFGESNPIASNATAAGKQANRRVEIQIAPLT